jgi:hypothetical protein
MRPRRCGRRPILGAVRRSAGRPRARSSPGEPSVRGGRRPHPRAAFPPCTLPVTTTGKTTDMPSRAYLMTEGELSVKRGGPSLAMAVVPHGLRIACLPPHSPKSTGGGYKEFIKIAKSPTLCCPPLLGISSHCSPLPARPVPHAPHETGTPAAAHQRVRQAKLQRAIRHDEHATSRHLKNTTGSSDGRRNVAADRSVGNFRTKVRSPTASRRSSQCRRGIGAYGSPPGMSKRGGGWVFFPWPILALFDAPPRTSLVPERLEPQAASPDYS